jgi:methyl-accepting chemotaxis protein
MNRITAYFDRIQGRLVSALALGALGMIVIYLVGSRSLTRFTDEMGDELTLLQDRISLAMQLESAMLGQIGEAQEYVLSRDSTALARSAEQALQVQDLHERMYSVANPGSRVADQLTAIRRSHTETVQETERALGEHAAGDPDAAVERIRSLEPVMRQLRGSIRQLNLSELRAVEERATEFALASDRQKSILLIVLLVSLAVALLLGYYTLQAVERPLHRLVLAANRFGEGDLSVAVDGRMPAEFSVLAGAFTGMAERFRVVVGEAVGTANRVGQSAADLSSISEEVAASSGEVSTAMIAITNGAEEQAFGLRTVDQALERMRGSAAEIEASSRDVLELSTRIGELAGGRREDVGRALAMLLELRGVVQSSSDEVHALEEASEKIATFVGTIEGIARQTNLLALNATIEAARAGEHGRGFAVVADEVRNLAAASARAAREVDATVSHIRQQIDSVVRTMEVGFRRVSGVEETSKEAEAAFEEIVAAVARVSETAVRVADAADSNRSAFETVDDAVRNVGAAAESHAASAQEVSAAAEEQSAATEEMSAASLELLTAAQRLKDLVSGFRL